MKIRYIFYILTFLMMISCSQEKKVRTIKLAHGLNIDHPVHKAMEFMGKELERNSGGKMKLKIYPSQQLGTERQCIELLQIGSLDMTKVSAAIMENFSPDMKIFGLPYLFRDRQHAFDVLDGEIGKQLLDGGIQYRLKGMGYYDSGSRSFYTKERPVEKPDDLKGLKIRVMESVTAMNMVSSLGGSPTPISWGELYTALQQGVVDGAENNPPSFYLSRHYEVCKYYSLDEHTSIPDVLVIGTFLWEHLSDQEKIWLQDAVDKSVIFQRELWKEAEREALEEVKKAGVTILKPDKKLFADKVKHLYDEYKDNKEMYDLINRIKETK